MRQIILILIGLLSFSGCTVNFNFGKDEPVAPSLPTTREVSLYFPNTTLDPEVSCDKVFPVKREIAISDEPLQATLEELFKGLTDAEKAQGFFNPQNENVKVQSVRRTGGTVYADFDEQLQFQIGGSCRIASVYASIIETLKQFEGVTEVVVSIDGRSEDILQP